MVQVSLSTTTTFEGDLNALVEDQGSSLTLRFDLDEPAPASGLKVYIDSDIEQIINRLDLPAAIANPRFENLNLFATQTNFDNSGLAVEIAGGSTFATVTLDIFDNPEPDTFLPETFDGLVEATLSLLTADQIAAEDLTSITNVGDYTIAPDAASSTVLFADTADQLPGDPPPPATDYDEAVSGDISSDPNNPLVLDLAEGTTRLTASTGNGDQEYVTVTVPEGFELSSLLVEAYTPNDVAFIGVQEGDVFTQPLDNSADTSEFLGYTLFGTSAVGTDILDNIGNGSNGADFGGQGFEGPLPAGTYTFALQQLSPNSDYTLAFNLTEAAVVENSAPVATDDIYDVVTAPGVEDPGFEVPTELTVDVAEGVLANDSDANGDDLSVAIATDPTNGTATLNTDGSFTYTPTDGFSTGEQDSFTYTVSDGNGGSDTGSVTIEAVAAPSPPPTGDAPVVTFETVPATFSEEDPNNLVEWKWTVTGDFPEDGITINLDTSGGGEGPFAFTEQFAADPQSEFINSDIVDFDNDTGRLNILLTEPEASFKLYFVDDILEEGTQEFNFQLADGDGYTVDPDTNGGLFTITDDNGGPGVGPTIGLTTSETELAEGDTLTITFTAEGEIPADGVQVLVQSDVPGSLGQFDLADLGNITTTGIEGLPTVGDGGGGSFFITMTEPTATITLDVFDDIVAEEPLPITFTVANGEEYEVDAANPGITLNISDEVQPAGPTVGLTVDKTDVTEGETITLSFAVDGDIPDGGLQILVNDTNSAQNQLRSLTEFDIANVQTTGLAEFPTPADGDSGFFVTLTEPNATITIPVFDDGADEDEANESFTFEVIDGEAYNVDEAASSFTLNISDPVDGGNPPADGLPVVSLEAIPTSISEEGSAEDRLLTLAFSVEGEIPEEGLVVTLENLFGITDQSDGEDDRGAFENLGLVPPFDQENNLIGIRLDANEATLQLPIANDLIEETTTFNFQLADGEGYTVNPDQSGTLFTITDDNGGPGVGPTVSFSASTTDLAEGDPFIVNFTVDGDIPEGGLEVLVQSPVSAALGQFDLADLSALQLSGISDVRPGDTRGQSFIATITDANASIGLSIFDDIVAEEPIEVPFTLANGELYEVDPAAETVTFTISDDPQPAGPTVGLTVDKTDVTEGDIITLTFAVDGEIPANGVQVLVNDGASAQSGLRSLTEFDIANVQTTGIAEFPSPADGDSGFLVTITDPTATITLPVLDDGADEDEANESFAFELIDGEAYDVDAAASGFTLNILDIGGENPPTAGDPIVTFSTDTTALVESESTVVTLNFNVEGPIPEGGLPITLNAEGSDPNWFFDFNNSARPSVNPETGSFDSVAILGREIQGIDSTRLIGSLAPPDFNALELVITENTASFQLEVFDDVFAEDTETLTLSVADGEGYAVAQNVAPITLTFEDSPAGRVDATSPVVRLALDKDTVAEGELLTVNLSVEGDIPTEGLQVFVAGSSAGALGEFAVSELQTTGLAGDPGPDADAGGFVVTMVENEASITLPVFKDGLGEGTENFTFSVVDGELYDIDPAASEVSLAIEETPPVISVDLIGATFDGDGAIAAPYLIEDDAAGDAILSVIVQSDAPIPEDGLVVNINTDLADITEFVDGTNFVPTAFGGEVLGAIYNDEGVATGLQVRMDNPNTVVNFTTGLGLEATGPQDVSFSVEAGENYIPSDETASIAVYDSADQTPMPTPVPEVGISVEQSRPLSEGSGAVTLNFDVAGEIPAEGVLVYVATGEFAGLVDFELLNAGVTGGPFPGPDGQAGGFFFNIKEPTASLTLQAREDEEVEGIESIDLAVQPLPGYTIADGSGDVSILLRDDRNSEIQVSLETAPSVLVESEGTVSLHTFSLSAPPPEEGITVTVQTPGLADFDASAVALTGITGLEVLESSPEQLRFTITEQTATIELPVANDGVTEGLEEAVFTLLEPDADANYQVNPEANSGMFTIVDTPADAPAEPITEDTRNSRDSIGDTIATAQATGLSAENSSISIEAAINGNFFNSDRTQTDTTEDVDMYSVDLSAGDVLRLDVDAQINSEDSPDSVLQIFDADGNVVAQSDDDFAPDELFAPGRRDSYIEFMPDADGTYYVGVSSFGNGAFDFFENDDGTLDNSPYDPNVAGSGAGRSDGPYTLNLSLNEAPSSAATEIPTSTGEGPTVSISATPATYDSSDNLIANTLVQYTPERRNASILTVGFDIEGDIPEEGIEAYLTSDIDLSTIFSTRSPFSSEGIEVLGAIYDDAGAPVGLRVNLTNNGFINLNLEDPEEAPADGEEAISFTLEPAAGYAVGEGSFSATIYDTLDDVPALPTVPTVGLSISETALVESEGNTTTLTFTLDSPPPEGGVTVNVDSGVRAALGEFDVFNAEIEGGNFPSPNFQASGFFFTITEQTATITLAAFDETTNPEIPAENVVEGIDEFTFTVQPGVGYAIAPDASAITLTIADNPDSVALPDNGGGDEGSDDLTEIEFNDTIADATMTGFGTGNPVFEATGEIGTTRATRNFVDRSEDVDMYAFELEAGQTVILDVDAGGTGDAGVEGSLMDSVLRVFDAAGNEVAVNDNGGASDEVFQANGDSYLEFEAPEAGTYYVGISSLGNNFYDPNVQASGSGWIFEDRFEPGPYRFTATLKGAVVSESGDTVSTNNDTIANAQVLDLSAENSNLRIAADITQRFEDRTNTADATEDVDMYEVNLTAGDRITIDADSVTTVLEGSQVGPAPDITIFDADGNKVVVGTDEAGEPIFAFSSRDGAPDEAFVANRDGYLDFTATADGTYYIGVSQYRNNNYDASVVGSGSGAFFSPRFGVSPGGEYTLDIALNPTGFDGPVYEPFTGTPDEDAPVVTFTTDAGTFVRAENRDDIVISSELIESEDAGRGVLNVAFTVDGEIPEGGLEVLVVNEDGVDLNDYFQELGGQPRIVVGGTLSGGLYAEDGALIGFKALITDNNALFPFTAATDREDDPNAPETLTFSLANSADYAASETANSSAVTFYDSLEQVQANSGPVPTVGFTFDQTEFIESEGTEGTLTVTVDGDIPPEGLQVYIDSEDRLLGEFDVFNAEVTGGAFPSPNGTASGFFFRVFEKTATIKLAVFDETTNDQIPAEDALEGIESFSIALQPLEGYTIDPNAASADFTIKDNPDSVMIPDEGGGDGEGEGEQPVVPVDTDSRDTINDTLETAVDTGLTADNSTVTIDGSIAIRWRNPDEQKADNTEDVDLYSVELAAGDSVAIDADSVPFELGGITQVTAPTLRVFNAAGNELAMGASDLTEGTISDPETLTFTATDAGTYYVGVSQYLNDNYDPMVNASGDGVQLPDEGISPGEYQLALTLTSNGGASPAPVVGFTIDPTVRSEEDAELGVDFNFAVDGEIPEGGLSILVQGDLSILDQADGSVDLGFENAQLGNLVSAEDGTFEVILTDNTGKITVPILNDVIQEVDTDFAFSILENDGTLSSNYTVDAATSTASVTLVDGQGGPGVGPTVGISVDNGELTEGDRFSVNFTVDGEIPAEGLTVRVNSDTLRSLGEFDIFDAEGNPAVEFSGIADFPIVGDATGSSFLVTLTEPNASLTLSVFEDGPNEGLENIEFSLIDGEIYEIDPTASSFSLSINDFESTGTNDSDTIVGDDSDNSIDGLGGSDIIAGGLANDIILGGDGNDVLRGDLNSRNPQDDDAGGNDIIFGGDGDDRIGGKSGNDILSGDAGDDFIWGDDGDDIIMGVTGNDTLVGDNGSNGSGSDLFVFGNGDGTDTIVDFEVGTDRIGLVEGELTFADLTLTQEGSNTLLGVASSGETLAILNGVQASALTESSFEVVADVSNPEEALALI
ncbi:MAG: pre-peptidase C-terminal domain-containing protein [Cyanobacteria bacterium J06634_6]